MQLKNVIGRTVGLVALASLVGCSGSSGGSGGGQAKLSVSLMDAPVDGVTAVYVKITSMWIKPNGNGPAVSCRSSMRR